MIDATGSTNHGVTISGALDGARSRLRFSAPGGAIFVDGIGDLPPTPSAGYRSSVEVTPATRCGWLFVRRRDRPLLVIAVAIASTGQMPGAPVRAVTMATQIPTG